MELTDLAAKETTALVERVERDIADLTGRLAIAAAADRDAAVERVAVEARAAAETLRAEIAARSSDLAAVSGSLADAHAEVAQLRGDIEDLRAAQRKAETLVETAHRELADARARHDQLDSERREAVTARDKETAARTSAETEIQDLREIAREHERARAELEAKLAATGDREDAAAALLDALLNGFIALATATTIPDILTTLVEQLAAEFPRVALFRPKANRLEGQHQIGFDLSNDITKVVMPLGLDSLLARAAASGHIESLSDGAIEAGVHALFGGSPSCAIAMPVVVQDETLAVVYADDWGSERQDAPGERAARLKYTEAMQQHAVALLKRLTSELKAMAELRAYATSLMTEIEQMYVADVAAEKTGEELRRRLQANVEYARSIYATRVAYECPDAATLIEDEITAAIEREAGGPYGRDLEAVAAPRAAEKLRA